MADRFYLSLKDRNFNASCQQAMYRRTGRAVIGRSESRPRRGQMRLVEADSTWEVDAVNTDGRFGQ